MKRLGVLLAIVAAVACNDKKDDNTRDQGATRQPPSMAVDSTRIPGDSTMLRDTIRQ